MGGAIPPSSYILTDDGNKRQRCFHAATPHAVELCGLSAGTGPRSRGRAGPGPRLPPPCPCRTTAPLSVTWPPSRQVRPASQRPVAYLPRCFWKFLSQHRDAGV